MTASKTDGLVEITENHFVKMVGGKRIDYWPLIMTVKYEGETYHSHIDEFMTSTLPRLQAEKYGDRLSLLLAPVPKSEFDDKYPISGQQKITRTMKLQRKISILFNIVNLIIILPAVVLIALAIYYLL